MVQPIDYHPKNSLFRTTSPFARGTPKEWSVDEFYELSYQQLLGTDKTVELVAGEICPLPVDETLDRHIQLLQYQLHQHFNPSRPRDWMGDWMGDGPSGGLVKELDSIEVRSRYPIQINQYSELKPAIAVLTKATVENKPMVQWVIDITDEGLNQANTQRSQLFAQAGIANYWSMTVSQVELRTYQAPSSNGYQRCKLLHVGDRATPAALPQITLQLHEPLPLTFLTRTLGGQIAYRSAALPLQVCPLVDEPDFC